MKLRQRENSSLSVVFCTVAHPVLDREELIFQPSSELTRSHIRHAIEIILSQPATINKALIEAITQYVEHNEYFPDNIESVKKLIKNRHLTHTSRVYRQNIIKFSLKKILFLNEDYHADYEL